MLGAHCCTACYVPTVLPINDRLSWHQGARNLCCVLLPDAACIWITDCTACFEQIALTDKMLFADQSSMLGKQKSNFRLSQSPGRSPPPSQADAARRRFRGEPEAQDKNFDSQLQKPVLQGRGKAVREQPKYGPGPCWKPALQCLPRMHAAITCTKKM